MEVIGFLKDGSIIGVNFENTNTAFCSIVPKNVILFKISRFDETGHAVFFGNVTMPYNGTEPIVYGEAGYTNYYMFNGTAWIFISRSDNATRLASTTKNGLMSKEDKITLNTLVEDVGNINTLLDAINGEVV